MNNNELGSLDELFYKSKEIVQAAREITGTVANLTTVISNFEIGRYLVEEEQKGELRAKYGKRILDELSEYLTNEFGKGFSRTNVASMRKFYLIYKDRAEQFTYLNANDDFSLIPIVQTVSAQSQKKKIPFQLSWSHYQVLMRIENSDERNFYEKEAISSNWDVRTLKRQYNSSIIHAK